MIVHPGKLQSLFTYTLYLNSPDDQRRVQHVWDHQVAARTEDVHGADASKCQAFSSVFSFIHSCNMTGLVYVHMTWLFSLQIEMSNCHWWQLFRSVCSLLQAREKTTVTTHTHAHMHAHTRTHACMHTHTHIHTHVHTHTCTHTRTHARTHACTHTHTHTQWL